MSDFILELRCEEIPARMQAGARAELEKLFRDHMAATGVTHGEIVVWSTPRRLALIARDLPEATAAVREEIKGPKTGAPPQALEGFLRKVGQSREQLEERGGVLFAVVERPGRETREVLSWAVAAIVRNFAWPKSMRWGAASLSAESVRWVRPLSGIVAILGEELVGCEVGGIAASYATLGHRFHHSGPITIGGAHDYQEKLRACHVIVDHAEREALIRDKAHEAARAAGLTLIADEDLVIENAALTEWPVPLLGRFDTAFLEVPPDVIQLTARTNQKYFVCQDGEEKLANAFVCTANIEAADAGAGIVDGNRKVLAARLADARFFWEQDRRKTLAQHAEKLGSIVFHEKLGTVADKVERVARLAEWLAAERIVPDCDPALARQAAELCKADLVTEMVGEFPELQGVMGGYYARAEGLPDAVADAIRDHYKPVGQGDAVPTAPVTVAVSLADKLDNVLGFFAWDLIPTGSKDPFALRRAAIGIIQLLTSNNIRLSLLEAADVGGWRFVYRRAFEDFEYQQAFLKRYFSQESLEDENFYTWLEKSEQGLWTVAHTGARDEAWKLIEFFADRLKIQQREAGVRHDLIDAVFALGGEDDLVRLLARVRALQAFVDTEDGANLLAGYKRAANILKKEGFAGGDEKPVSYTPEPAERALIEALTAAEPRAREAVAAEDFAGAMGALASLRGPIDAFFDHVTVNDPDPAKRAARLALLARFRSAVHQVADFSKIEG